DAASTPFETHPNDNTTPVNEPTPLKQRVAGSFSLRGAARFERIENNAIMSGNILNYKTQ
ncbi:MAG: hypothetical protein AB1801_17035, partial [Chloroflexota bacterium]